MDFTRMIVVGGVFLVPVTQLVGVGMATRLSGIAVCRSQHGSLLLQ